MNATKFPVTVRLPAKYLGVDVLAQLAQVDDAAQMRTEIRQLKASRARLIEAQETTADALAEARSQLAEARERNAALTTELYRCRAEVDEFENACTALTGCVGGVT